MGVTGAGGHRPDRQWVGPDPGVRGRRASPSADECPQSSSLDVLPPAGSEEQRHPSEPSPPIGVLQLSSAPREAPGRSLASAPLWPERLPRWAGAGPHLLDHPDELGEGPVELVQDAVEEGRRHVPVHAQQLRHVLLQQQRRTGLWPIREQARSHGPRRSSRPGPRRKAGRC